MENGIKFEHLRRIELEEFVGFGMGFAMEFGMEFGWNGIWNTICDGIWNGIPYAQKQLLHQLHLLLYYLSW
jgi:hypothetical protein